MSVQGRTELVSTRGVGLGKEEGKERARSRKGGSLRRDEKVRVAAGRHTGWWRG